MSSEISTSRGGSRATPTATSADRLPNGNAGRVTPDLGLQPWQFFVLAALGLSTAVTFMLRGQGIIPVVMVSVLMATTALAGLSMWRLLRPLVSADDDRTPMIGQRTRAALEREKMLALRAIKELDFDRAMGKLSESDWKEMSGRLRGRAARLIRQLDAGSGYRVQIERDLAKRLEHLDARPKSTRVEEAPVPATPAHAPADRWCGACATPNDADARFCKNCGQKLL